MRRGKLFREFPVAGPLRVEIEGGASDVYLRAHGERSARVEVTYVVHGLGRSAKERERRLLADPPLQFLEDLLRAGPEPDEVSLNYALFLPPEAEVEVVVVAGDVAAAGFSKKVRIATGSGDVVLHDITGEVRVRCGSGDVRLGRVFGALAIHTGSGDITGEDVKGDVDVETSSGDVILEGMEGELRILTRSGDVKVTGRIDEGTWRIHSGSGDVHLRLPGDLAAVLHLRTGSGDIHCNFSLTTEVRREGELRGWVGEAPRARILVQTGSGDITLSHG